MPIIISFITTIIIFSFVLVLVSRTVKNDTQRLAIQNAFFYQRQGKIAEALQSINEAFEQGQPSYQLYYTRSLLLFMKKDYPPALADAKQAIEIDPQNHLAYGLRSEIYRFNHQNEEALADANKLLSLKPMYALGYVIRALAFVASKKYADGLKDAEHAIRKLHYEDFLGYFTRGLCHLGLKEYEDAIYDFDKAYAYADKPEQHYEAIAKRKEAFVLTKNFVEALADSEEMIELKPTSESYAARARVYRMMKDYENTLSDFQKAYELDSNETKWRMNIANVYLLLGQNDEAFAIYHNLIQSNQTVDLAYNARAWAKASLGDYSDALADAEKALDLNPKIASFYDTRAQAKWLLGDYENALVDYEKAIELADDKELYFDGKAVTLLKLGQREEALAIWRENKSKSAADLQDEYRFAQPFYETLQELEKLSME